MTTTRPHGRGRTTPVVVALLAVAALGPASAGAARAPSAVCATSFTSTISPGFTTTPSSGKATSRGQTGDIECFGRLGNDRFTGPGSLGFVARHASGSCRGHVGIGRVHLILPTAAGSRDMVGALVVRRTALAVRVRVRFPGARFRGSGVVFPRIGNCSSSPLEQVKLTITGSFTET